MSTTLPAQMRRFIVDIHAASVSSSEVGRLRSNSFKRDRDFLKGATDRELLYELPRFGKQLDYALARGAEPEFQLSLEDGPSNHTLDRNLFRLEVEGVRRCEPSDVRALRQVCHLLSKFQTESAYSDEVFNEFVKRNAENPDVIPDFPELWIARCAMGFLLGSLDLRDIIPKHGPGAVATREQPWEKMGFKRIYRSMDTLYPVCDYFFLNSSHLCDRLADLFAMTERDYPSTRMVAVPKDFRGPRLISAEPLETQWIQQGQMRSIVQHVERHPLTMGHVNFTSQDVNRSLALSSSIKGDYVTLDLKDASDRVSYALVRSLMPSGVFRYLDASRSHSTVLPSGTEVELKMFSPMGSAVCFPIESLVFWALLVGAVHHVKFPNRRPNHKSVWACGRDIYVYGDDLIVRSAYVDPVIHVLSSAGLVVNMSKTCVGPRFRESCGLDAYAGQDVSPVRIKHWPNRLNPVTLASAVDYINNLRSRNMTAAADLLYQEVSREFGPIPYSTHRGLLAIHVSTVAEAVEWNFRHFRSRRNRDLQCYEFLCPELQLRYKRSHEPVWCEAFRSILLNAASLPQGYPVPHRVRLTTRWKPL